MLSLINVPPTSFAPVESRYCASRGPSFTQDDWIFDFSFPAEHGDPNPHLWMNPVYAAHYADLIRDTLVEMDSTNAAYYTANFGVYNRFPYPDNEPSYNHDNWLAATGGTDLPSTKIWIMP